MPRANSVERGKLATDNAHSMEKRESVRILICFQCGFMHETANGKVGQDQPAEFLLHQVRGLAAENDFTAP